jgi:hypothetical protein
LIHKNYVGRECNVRIRTMLNRLDLSVRTYQQP